MTKLTKGLTAAAAAALLVGLMAAGASARGSGPDTRTAASIQVCALLPDTKSSTRYTLFDAPYLKAAFKKAGVAASVLNALGDPQKQRSQAEQCLARGAKVIDYDRLVVGSKASYYVSHDSVRVGKFMGLGLVAALKANGKYSKKPVVSELHGDIKDNNAKLFRQGYDSVLNPLYKNGTFKKAKGGDQYTDWDPIKGRRIFDQILARNGNKVDASIAANDGLAGAVIASLKAHGLKPIPLTGQDATPTGVQFVLAGWQTGTVYKSVRQEANAAAAAAIAVVKGRKVPGVNTKVSGTPSILLKPIWVTKRNYKLLFRDGALKRSQVCVGQYKKYCK